jgi:hypothetical protein
VADVLASGVSQQRAFGESRGRVHARLVVGANDRLCCLAAVEDTIALCDAATSRLGYHESRLGRSERLN